MYRYFPFRPAEKIACSWTAMQVIDKANGCLFVVPGTHTGELKMHGYPNDGIVNKAYHGIHGLSEKDTESMLWVEMQPGMSFNMIIHCIIRIYTNY